MIKTDKQEKPPKRLVPQLIILCCMIVFIYSIGATVAPLQRLLGTPLLAGLPTNGFLEAWGGWLPVDLHLVSEVQTSQASTEHLEFFLLIAVAFILYGSSALVIRYHLKETKNRSIWLLMWTGAIIVGLIFVFTPALLSHDIFVYADYGHTIVVHGGNPYFVPPGMGKFSRDVLTQLDDWRMYIAAYGPLWLDICSFLALMLGSVPWHYIFGFRLLGLVAHLFNIVLVTAILRKAGCTQRTTLLGTWLYAINPLVLLESSFGAHNDVVIATFLLLGILFCLRAEERGFSQPANYIPPVVAFTLAALIKFTMLPLILFFLVLLARKTLRSTMTSRGKAQRPAPYTWYAVCTHVFLASAICIFTMLAFYGPFWMGHPLKEIVQSFSLPPSATHSENSFSRVLYQWTKLHGLPSRSSWLYLPLHLLSKRSFWNMLTGVVVACTMGTGIFFLWRLPTTKIFILAVLACLGALLVVTPWFYPWYIIWPVALAGASFSLAHNRMRRPLVGFALMFSFTALLTYISNTIALLGEWAPPVQYTVILGVPLIVFVMVLKVRRDREEKSL